MPLSTEGRDRHDSSGMLISTYTVVQYNRYNLSLAATANALVNQRKFEDVPPDYNKP